MTRIDPITVLEAYTWTGTKPTLYSDFVHVDMLGDIRACPFVAVALAAKRRKAEDFHTMIYGLSGMPEFSRIMADGNAQTTEGMGIARRLLDVTRPYMVGFVYGYDWGKRDLPVVMHYQADYDMGLADGATVRAVLDKIDLDLEDSDFKS